MNFFGIQVVDEATGRGVPLVELETTNNIVYVTDSKGWVAITDPGLYDREVFFSIRSSGYTYPKDGFGYAGVRLRLTEGGRGRITLRRTNIAERLCRLTGEGIYADSALLSEPMPLRAPLLSGEVFGQDSAMAAVYKGKLLWFWGDTGRARYPLGNFRTTGAIATLPEGKKTAENGLDYAYFVDADGFARAMCPSDKPGPIWIGGLTVVQEGGEERLLAHYARMKDLGTRLEQGYVLWKDDTETFGFIKELPLRENWRFLDGHPIDWTEDGVRYRAGGFCFPVVRVRATLRAILEPRGYEAFTCLNPDGSVKRDKDGRAVYGWQHLSSPITPAREAELVKAKKLRWEEARFLPRDSRGDMIIMHGGSVTWNPWRRKWLLIATRFQGKESALGEIYYAEAERPTGPWQRTVKIVTHDRYTFYNPVHHPFLDAEDGRVIFFEGTFTRTFSSATSAVPRYEYNQILYRLDLASPGLQAVRL